MLKMIFGGGLGNQMFQYAFLYSKVCKTENIIAIMHRNVNEDVRNFSLDNYNCSIKFKIFDENKFGLQYKVYLLKKKVLSSVLTHLGLQSEEIIKRISRKGILFVPDIYGYYPELVIRDNMFIEGAFQNWRYFDHLKKELCEQFIPKMQLTDEQNELIEKMKRTESICLHIRRGDYLSAPYYKILGVCDRQYYYNAMKIIEKNVKNPEYFVFTNTHADHLWIQQNYRINGNVNYVDMNNPDYLELYLMSKCRHFIISNSTFSWWAQYLAENDGKIVIAPSKWYRGNDSAQEIYMPDWKIVEVD